MAAVVDPPPMEEDEEDKESSSGHTGLSVGEERAHERGQGGGEEHKSGEVPTTVAEAGSSGSHAARSSLDEDKDEDIFAETYEELSLDDPPQQQHQQQQQQYKGPAAATVTTLDLSSPPVPASGPTGASGGPGRQEALLSSVDPLAAPSSVYTGSATPAVGMGVEAAGVQPPTRPPLAPVAHKAAPVAVDNAAAREEGEGGEGERYNIEISVKDPKKIGDGMNAYMAYKVITKTNIPDFHHTEAEVYRRFSDFLGLHEKLAEKHLHLGRIIPPPPEKSVLGMTKIKMKEEASSSEFVEQRRAALERFLNAVAQHPVLQTDPSLVDFLELEGELPRSTSTSALSSSSVLKLFNRVGDSLGKMTYKMEESDQWFEEKGRHVELLDAQLRKLHASLELLVAHRKELAQSTGTLSHSLASLGAVEEHTSLSRALSSLASLQERADLVHVSQADADFYLLAELFKDHIGLVHAVKEVFSERVKLYKAWKDDEAALSKRREAKARLELAHKTDKMATATQEIVECEHRVERSRDEFESISRSVKKEFARFERQRSVDIRAAVVQYLQTLLNNQQQLIQYWEAFLPEAKVIA